MINNLFLLRNFLPDNPKINYLRASSITFCISIFLIIATFVGLYAKSLNFGIDFTGGLLFEVRLPENSDIAKIRSGLNKLDIGEVTIQSLDGSNDVLIRAAVKDELKREQYSDSIRQELTSQVGPQVEFRKTEFVGAEVGSDMIYKGAIAILLTFVGIMIYIWFRFDFRYSIGVALGLLHDIILTIGFLVITRYEFNVTSVAAILTILGYSVNDTVVIYDRVREKLRLLGDQKKINVQSTLNASVNETLSRTLLTVITTLLAAAALIIFGGEALKSFSITVFIGIIIGTYSSIFISIPILNWLSRERTYPKEIS